MKATKNNDNITITYSKEEIIVLFEWLHNFNENEINHSFQDQSEQRILWDMEAELEKIISIIFDNNYQKYLSKARQEIRDNEK